MAREWLLAEQHEGLQQKGLIVAAVQASPAEAEALKTWKEANPVRFPVERVPEKSDKTKWISGVQSLPWLILVDGQGRVSAEGFPIEELATQLQALAK